MPKAARPVITTQIYRGITVTLFATTIDGNKWSASYSAPGFKGRASGEPAYNAADAQAAAMFEAKEAIDAVLNRQASPASDRD